VSRVACVGIAVLDIVFQVPAIPAQPGKYRATQRTTVGGGVAANAAAAVRSLGGHPSFYGVLGDDAVGDEVEAGLEGWGIDTHVRRVTGEDSPLSAVLVDDHGERMIVNHAGRALYRGAAPPTPDELDGADVVLADMRWADGAIAALQWARASGRPAIVDCDHDPADAPGVLEAATHVVFALPTLRRWTERDEPLAALSAAAARTGAWVAATAGGEGVYWLENGEMQHGPADEVEAVDTLGAGDVFHGAFALAVAESRPLHDALRWASAAAALKCTRFGGRAGIPKRDEVDRFVEERGPWT
jgi:sulfofructose kinase